MSDGAGKVASEILRRLSNGSLIGLGSGSTMASLLPFLASEIEGRGLEGLRWVPTSVQIQVEAQKVGLEMVPLTRGYVDLVVDGADQVDSKLNLIKGGGGALLKEKVLLSSARRSAIVVQERKVARRLCEHGVAVPVETAPFAREPVAARLSGLGGRPQLRLDQRGYPFYTENGNVIFDTRFKPIEKPAVLEREIKSIAGVVEVGIFVIRPLEVYSLGDGGRVRILKRS